MIKEGDCKLLMKEREKQEKKKKGPKGVPIKGCWQR